MLSAWMALAAPALIHTQTSTAGVFDAGRPIDGLLGLIGIIGAVICLASHNSDSQNATGSLATVMVGPFVGGIMLIAVSTATALSLTTTEVLMLIVILAVIAILVRIRLPTIIRRALVTPYIIVSGSLFWRLIDEVTGGDLISQLRMVPLSSFQAIEPVVGFLLAFSAIYYAMLIYAPRQFTESEGSLLSWLIRYLLFALGIWLGATWLTG